MELALEQLERYKKIERICDRIKEWIVHICLQQIRVGVISGVKGEIVEEHCEEAIKGANAFYYE
jgi:tyrosine-protein phosphatase YwqE